ncbi:programmed cell death protein 2 [Cantharellus anzutake]|uniref:programmed cell death protein 2 n=1 Tax=Cantharellus anzutake TaxID=1750568 RepID=UPI001907878D|nr:programmed cell death protein 2 [Cantharellus anzutake]KAF8327174.1 programmed cell death protein 2 [Cantharellus anzutake]
MPLDEYSDSDESDAHDIRTSVLLGLADGAITSDKDLSKIRVSRIGGKPVFPVGTPAPPLKVSHCDSCSSPMELLVQLWCPFEGSAFDRVLYVWGCARRRCQRKPGSVKAGRALRYNSKYAAKLAAKLEKRKAELATPRSSNNPFSFNQKGGFAPQLFAGGFDGPSPLAPEPAEDNEGLSSGDPSSASEDEDEDDGTGLSRQIAGISLDDNSGDWSLVPSYLPFYLDSVGEYIAPPSAISRSMPKASVGQDNDGQWVTEGYERTKEIDPMFEKFTAIVSEEPQQCLRYELSGIPLPFSSESVYKSLFPPVGSRSSAPREGTVITGSGAILAANADEVAGKRVYEPSVIRPCDACGGPRVFECQLMPNLINVVRAASQPAKKTLSAEERKSELARLLKGPASRVGDETNSDAKEDMEWGTCMVFSCISDCCRRKGANDVWSDAENGFVEEVVMVQWDT